MSFDDVRCRLWACAKRCSWKVPKDFLLIYAYMCIYHPDTLSAFSLGWSFPRVSHTSRHPINLQSRREDFYWFSTHPLCSHLTSDSPKASCHQLPVSLFSVLSHLVFLHRVSSCKYLFYFYIVFHEPFEPLKICFCKRLLF